MVSTTGDLPDQARAALDLAGTYLFGTDPGRIPAQLREAYDASTDAAVRARLGAALARCWAYAGEPNRAAPFAEEAVAAATATGDDVLLADALDASLTTHWGPDELAVRRGLVDRLDEVAAHLTDPDARTQAHIWMLTVALESLDLPGMNRHMRALEVLGEESPKALFYAASRRLTLDLLRGRTDTTEELVEVAARALERVELADGWMVLAAMEGYGAVHAGDQVVASRLAARAEEIAVGEGIRELYAEAAWIWIAAGRHDRALALAETFDAGVLARLPRNLNYLLTLQLLLDVALQAGATDLVGRVAPQLMPYAGRAVVNAGAVAFHGVTDDTLGRAAYVLGDEETGRRLTDRARATYARIGATWWRERLDRWAPPEVPGTAANDPTRMTLCRGPRGSWLVGHDGAEFPLPSRKGFEHLHTLLSQPGHAQDALTLVGGKVLQSDLGPLADATALAAYRRRIDEIDAALDDTDLRGDADEAQRLTLERSALVAELASAAGLGGRPRATGGSAERARVSVRKAIRAAVDLVTEVDPVVGRHLSDRVRTGFVCVYEPDPDHPVDWELVR